MQWDVLSPDNECNSTNQKARIFVQVIKYHIDHVTSWRLESQVRMIICNVPSNMLHGRMADTLYTHKIGVLAFHHARVCTYTTCYRWHDKSNLLAICIVFLPVMS